MANRRADVLMPHAWWLVPAEPWHTRLQAEIAGLAARTGGPVFEPHLTLAIGPLPAGGLDWHALAASLSQSLPALSLQAGPRGHTARYFQTLFVRFGQHPDAIPALAARQQQLGALLAAVAPDAPVTTAPAFEPHLSLCYADLPAPTREQLAGSNGIEGQWITFDTLVGVRPREGALTMDRVADWDCFLRIPLGA
ncbi:MAG: hypothetical protein Q4B17_12725 [Lautropia sp.]|nr:hypothetical protein [Lautropia sp.]